MKIDRLNFYSFGLVVYGVLFMGIAKANTILEEGACFVTTTPEIATALIGQKTANPNISFTWYVSADAPGKDARAYTNLDANSNSHGSLHSYQANGDLLLNGTAANGKIGYTISSKIANKEKFFFAEFNISGKASVEVTNPACRVFKYASDGRSREAYFYPNKTVWYNKGGDRDDSLPLVQEYKCYFSDQAGNPVDTNGDHSVSEKIYMAEWSIENYSIPANISVYFMRPWDAVHVQVTKDPLRITFYNNQEVRDLSGKPVIRPTEMNDKWNLEKLSSGNFWKLTIFPGIDHTMDTKSITHTLNCEVTAPTLRIKPAPTEGKQGK